MNSELTRLLTAMGIGLLIGGCIAISILISRWKKDERLIPESKPTPRWVWPFGILVFESLAAMAFLTDQPVFGSAFSLALIPYAVSQIRLLTSKKANKTRLDNRH